MLRLLSLSLAALAFAGLSNAQQSAYGQCGGLSWTGQTTCVSGYKCNYYNDWYWQCIPGTATTTAAVATTTATVATTTVGVTLTVTVTKATTVARPTSSTSSSSPRSSSSPSTRKASSTATTVKSTNLTTSKKTITVSSATSSTKATTFSTKATTSSTSSTLVKVTTSSTKATTSSTAKATTSSITKATTSATTPSNAVNTACSGSLTKFKYYGVNEAGAEFGSAYPGTKGTDYIWPSTSSIDYFLAIGFNTFRVDFMMERLTPSLTGGFSSAYLADLKSLVSHITGKGGYAVLDPHNYGRFKGQVMTDYNAFGTWCKNLATEFKDNAKVIFDTNNEYNNMDQTLVFNLNQACITGIRAAGAKQLILVEGNAWSGAHSWVSSGNAASLINLVDPLDNMAYEMHQYLDGDSSGTSATCVSGTIGAERLAAATKWLKDNGKKGFLGEIGGGSSDTCIAAVKGALCSMQQSGVWIGALWWAAGPWWGSYFQSIEPPNGAAISRILPEALMPFI